NKAQCFVTPLLEAMQLTAYLTFIVAGDTLQAKKPDPSPLLHAINNFGVNLEQTVMVGDSINDVQAARAARIAVICVSYGYNHGRDIRESQPDIVIDSFSQLPTAIASMN
ncbi:phosphoglycolate phosphatase, partial [Achromatium sp. WMS2]